VEIYTPLLLSWCRRLDIGREDAEELIQEVLLLLTQKLPEFTYDPQGSFRRWLHTVLVNKWRDHQRENCLPVVAADSRLGEVPAPDEQDAIWDDEYRQYLVSRALALMQRDFEPVTWKACWESIVGGKPAAAVAAQLGVTENSVYVAKSRVLRRLRQELAGLMD
jgi:RNA polymerase sigma-70 factor (ECF subfamily)